jgi:hypothetical protein
MPIYEENDGASEELCRELSMQIAMKEEKISYEAILHALSNKGTTPPTLRKICQCVKKQPNSAYRDPLIDMICDRLLIVNLSPEYKDALYELAASL